MAVNLPRTPLQRSSLREQVYEVVLQAIVNADFPPGHQIRDLDIARSLGVSRTPVREALQRLVDEGLVETAPGAATRVTPIDVDAVRNIYPNVGALHALAVRLGAARIGRSELEELTRTNDAFAAAVAKRQIVAALAADDAFHGIVIRAARNPELERALDRLMPHIRRLQLAQFGSEPARLSIRQHKAIVTAFRRDSVDDAMQTMEENWSNIESLLRHGDRLRA
jgi:DNA-binding GntR family transcriptional regulator